MAQKLFRLGEGMSLVVCQGQRAKESRVRNMSTCPDDTPFCGALVQIVNIFFSVFQNTFFDHQCYGNPTRPYCQVGYKHTRPAAYVGFYIQLLQHTTEW